MTSDPAPEATTVIRPPVSFPPKRRWGLRFLSLLVLLAIGVAVWAWITLTWNYSDGDRAGVLQKFSRKGWVCKTWEGELAQYVVPGLSPQIWQFTVRDATVASQLTNHLGEKVQLHYLEHRGVPTSCFGETSYYVDRLVKSEKPAVSP
jgi:hypothetical protein